MLSKRSRYFFGVLAIGIAFAFVAKDAHAQRKIPVKISVDAQQLFRQLELDKVYVHFHAKGSYVRVPTAVPGRFRTHKLPDLPSWSKRIGIGRLRYSVNDINSKAVRLDKLQSGLIVGAVEFETNSSEIRGTISGPLPNRLAPDIHARSLQVLVKMPFSFNVATQSVKLGNPTLQVQAQWSLNVKFLPSGIRDKILKDRWINNPIQREGNKVLAALRPVMEQRLNNAIRQRVRSGRITRLTIQNGNVVLEAEVPVR